METRVVRCRARVRFSVRLSIPGTGVPWMHRMEANPDPKPVSGHFVGGEQPQAFRAEEKEGLLRIMCIQSYCWKLLKHVLR